MKQVTVTEWFVSWQAIQFTAAEVATLRKAQAIMEGAREFDPWRDEDPDRALAGADCGLSDVLSALESGAYALSI